MYEGPLRLDELEELKRFEDLRNSWLKKEEQEWRLKSKALLAPGKGQQHEILPSFCQPSQEFKYDLGIKNEEGAMVSSFQEKAEAGGTFFENLFTTPNG
jgi:hypothetical protein